MGSDYNEGLWPKFSPGSPNPFDSSSSTSTMFSYINVLFCLQSEKDQKPSITISECQEDSGLLETTMK